MCQSAVTAAKALEGVGRAVMSAEADPAAVVAVCGVEVTVAVGDPRCDICSLLHRDYRVEGRRASLRLVQSIELSFDRCTRLRSHSN